MIASLPLAWVLSAVFVLTGGYAVVRWSATMTGPLPAAGRTTELAHLVMSVSMLVMTWTWFGTAGLTVQVLLFTLFAAYFAVRTVRGWRGAGHTCPGGAAHTLMAAAMVWMLVSMPLVMAAPVAGGSDGGHAGHAGHGGGDTGMAGMAGSTGPAGWAVGVTLAVSVALVVACGYWVMRALRHAPVPAAPVAPSGTGGVATLERVQTRVRAPLGTRSDAACHAAMSLGMAVMMIAMVAGW